VDSEENVYTDEQLKALAITAQRHPPRSRERRRAISQLIQQISNARRLCRPRQGQFIESYEEIYGVAVQNLMLHVCQRIDTYKPESGPVMRWVNFLLERRFFNEAVAEVLGRKTTPPKLCLYEETQSSITPESSPCLSELVKQVIEEDVGGVFATKSVRGHAEANFRVLFKRRIVEKQSWEQIATELGIKVPTLSDFYQRCLRQFAPEIKLKIHSE
jgi:hypothetical protein